MLLKGLPNPPRPNKTYMNNKREIRQNNVGNLEGPIPYGFTWGLVLLKALPKPPIPVGIFTPKSQRENGDNICNVVNTKFKAREIFVGPMPYGITWLLMPYEGLT